jgi:hypothetical protein
MDHNDVPAVAWLVPTVFFFTLLAIVCAALYAGFRKDGNRHQTLRALIEKGGEIPKDLLLPQRGSDLRKGIVLVCTGLGLAIALKQVPLEMRLWTVGVIPGLIGVGYLVVWRLERGPRPTP